MDMCLIPFVHWIANIELKNIAITHKYQGMMCYYDYFISFYDVILCLFIQL